ncbi:helix-turn-helix domain-containing protein [Paenibacillus hamazuiensis]|uniref:helix-turn-helix domain-containing protein n=1 Tax=Paenibacillus hamazuiensis TaxID=2936508 RepID=UPI00200F3651|nr:helix-turn-helix domain-containing protein [Paenibacillus hamazuiensis]
MKRLRDAARAKIGSVLSKTSYLRRMIWLGCISVAVPIVLSGAAYYQFAMNKLVHQFQEDSRASLTTFKDRLENVLTRIELESLQISTSSAVRSALGKADFADRYVQQTEMMDSFLFQKSANNLIEDIVFYESASNVVLSGAYGQTSLENSPQREIIRNVLSMKNQAGWIYSPGIGAEGCLTYVRQLPVMKIGAPQGALLVHVKIDALRKQLFDAGLAPHRQSLVVMDADRRIMLHSSEVAAIGQAAGQVSALKRVLGHDDANEYAMLKDDANRMLIMFHKTALGRSYVIMMPEAGLVSQLDWVRAFVAASVLFCLSVGVLLTYLSSKMVYSPIDRLIRYGKRLHPAGKGSSAGAKENEIEFIHSCLAYLSEQAESLNRYVKQIQPDLRDRFLLKLLQADGPPDPGAAEPYLRLYRIPAEGLFIAMIVKVDNLFKEKRFLPGEGAVIVFAVNNIIAELLEHYPGIAGYVVDREGKESAVILHFAEAASDIEERRRTVRLFAGEICTALKKYMSFTVSVGIGGERSGLELLHESYVEARQAIQSRLLHDVDAVLFYEEETASREKATAFNYPRKLESDLLEALSRGELPEAEKALLQFSRTIRSSGSYDTVMQCYHVLLSSIIRSLEHEGYGAIDQLGGNLFEQLKARQTSQEVQDWFIESLFPLHRRVTEEFRANQIRIAIRRVCRHIEDGQGMPTLVECAELVRLSPSYLSRMFKKETGVAFIEYVMQFKLEKAKRLLAETDLGIAEIAGIVGYSERNLNRAFKRHVKCSPKMYRLSARTGGDLSKDGGTDVKEQK